MAFDQLPKISIVMVDGSFREGFHSVDFFGKQTLPPEDYELLWVEYYDKVNPALAEKTARYPNFRVITLNRAGLYHSSYCFNEGIRASRGELIVIPDADVVVEENFLETILNEHQRNPNLVLYCYRYEEPREAYQATANLEHLRNVCQLHYPSNYGACLTVRKKWLVEINGYEQHPVFSSAVHSNGRDLHARFKSLGLDVKWHPKIRMYHLWHPRGKSKSNAYLLQNAITDYRAQHLQTLAFQGLDGSRSVPLPSELEMRLRTIQSAYRRQNENLFLRFTCYAGTLRERLFG